MLFVLVASGFWSQPPPGHAGCTPITRIKIRAVIDSYGRCLTRSSAERCTANAVFVGVAARGQRLAVASMARLLFAPGLVVEGATPLFLPGASPSANRKTEMVVGAYVRLPA